MKNALKYSILIGGALLAGGCMMNNEEKDAEYDKYKDTEVTQATAQASLAAEIGYMQDWDASMESPISGVEVPGTTDSARWPAMQKASVLTKTSADDPMVIDSSTRANGYITISVRRPGSLQTTYDTAVVRWDAQARDNISDNENIIRWSHTVVWLNGSLIERAAFSDADGDGIVNVVSGSDNRVRIEFRKTSARLDSKQQVETAVVVAGPGPDNNFDTEADNRLYQADWDRKLDGVLLATVKFTDDDGDSMVLNNAAVSVVRLSAWESEPAFRPRVKSVGATVRVRKLGFGLGEEPVGFTYTDTLWNGRTHKVFLKNSDGGADIVANDTLRVFLETRQKDGNDSLRSLDVVVALNLGANLKSESDDVFYSIKTESHNRFGFHRDVKFEVVSSTPVPRGQEVQNGTFLFAVTYANRKTVSLVGTFTPSTFDGTYTAPNGSTAVVHINR